MKILIVDDDPIHRALLESALKPHYAHITVVETGQDAVEKARREPFDIFIADWMMPEMDGIEVIRRVRALRSPPPFIIMNTVLASEVAREYAIRSGADDFLAKPSPAQAIVACVATACARHKQEARAFVRPAQQPPEATLDKTPRPPHVCIAIASSAGGPNALHAFFADPSLPSDCVYFVAQHGPDWMHKTISETLQRVTKLRVNLAVDGGAPRAGHVYLACSARHLVIDPQLRMALSDSPEEHFLRPAADPLFRSVARTFGRYAVAVILTGMGHDGALGAMQIAAAGGNVVAQDPATALARGMPQAAIGTGIVHEVQPLEELPRVVARRAAQLTRQLAR